MGYTTDFEGSFTVSPPLAPSQVRYLNAFSNSRRMKRNPDLCADETIRDAVKLPPGEDGCYVIGDSGDSGIFSSSVVDHNSPPDGQPGLWCQWVASESGEDIYWDGSEKFYRYEEWIRYIADHFLEPWGVEINGEVNWQGEDTADRGTLYAKSNQIQAVKDTITNNGPDRS